MWQWKKQQKVYKTGALPQTPAFIALKPTAYVKKAGTKHDTKPMPYGIVTVLRLLASRALSTATDYMPLAVKR